METEILKWTEYINANIRGNRTKQALIKYVTTLLQNNAVVILDFEHLAKLFGIKTLILARLVNSSESFYYNFKIPKRKGGEREISAPFPVLRNAQEWIYENLLLTVPLHPSAKGFIRNLSIVDNAKAHLNTKYLLKMDIEDFFPSIPINRIIAIFRRFGYTKKMSYYLASICCLNKNLPQGACTSPMLSNIIAKRLDERLFGLASKFGLSYTRYADDLTFSGNELPVRIISYVEKIVEQEGFKINKAKTKLLSENKQKIITGVSISSGKLTIPKSAKREVRKNIYHIKTKGLFEHQKAIESYDPIYLERLLGYLYFWFSVEPENHYIQDSIKFLREYSIELDKQYLAELSNFS